MINEKIWKAVRKRHDKNEVTTKKLMLLEK